VETDLLRVDLDLARLASSRQECEQNLVTIQEETEALLAQKRVLEDALGVLQKGRRPNTDSTPGQGSTLPPGYEVGPNDSGFSLWLYERLLQDDATAINELILGLVQIQRRIFQSQMKADSLQNCLRFNAIQEQDLTLTKDHDIVAKKVQLHRDIENFRLERDHVLPNTRANLVNQIRAMAARLALISPVEKVGHITVSDQPVRPRRLRAMAILFLLGALGALVLAFTWDYLAGHKEEIFRS
jgi:hypothetical protein